VGVIKGMAASRLRKKFARLGKVYWKEKVKKILKGWHVHQSLCGKGICFDKAMMVVF
jgi:hypothetical protein